MALLPACAVNAGAPPDGEQISNIKQADTTCSPNLLSGAGTGESLVCNGAWVFTPPTSGCNAAPDQCPPDQSQVVGLSEPGITHATFLSEYAGVIWAAGGCTTCDDLPLDDVGSAPPSASAIQNAQAKFDCLALHLNELDRTPKFGPWITTHTTRPPTIDANGIVKLAGQMFQRVRGDGEITVALSPSVGTGTAAGISIGGRSTINSQPSAWIYQSSEAASVRNVTYDRVLGPGQEHQSSTMAFREGNEPEPRQLRIRRTGNSIELWVRTTQVSITNQPTFPIWQLAWSDTIALPPVVDVGLTTGSMRIVDNTFQSLDSEAHAKIVADMKLLYELQGHMLRPDQQAAAQNEYFVDDAVPQCTGAAFSGSLDPACQSQTIDAQRKLALCERMTADYVPAASSDINVEFCDNLFADAVPTCDAGNVFLPEVNRIATALTRKTLQGLPLDMSMPAASTHDALQTMLRRIDTWYMEAQGLESGDPLWNDVSDMSGLFWAHVHSHAYDKLASATGGGGDPAAAVEMVFQDTLEAERRVLTAAFTPMADGRPPLATAPLLFILGDSLRPIVDRLNDASLFHDIGCRFSSCTGGGVVTPVVDAWRLLAALPDPVQLNAEVAASSLGPAWTSVFNLMAQNHHATLQAPVAQTLGTNYAPALWSAPPSTLPRPFQGLAGIVQQAQAYRDAYAKTGLLVDTHNVLRMGLTDEMLGTVASQENNLTQRISSRQNALSGDIATYTANRSAYVSGLLSEMQNHASTQHLQDDENQKLASIQQLDGDIDGLMGNLATDELTFGQFMSSFQSLAAAAVDPNLHIPAGTFTLNVRPSDALYPGNGAVTSLNTVMVTGKANLPLSIQRGDVVNISIAGSWSPTGALRDAVLGGQSMSDSATAATGPEGFIVTNTAAHYDVKGFTTSVQATQSSVRPFGDCTDQRLNCNSGMTLQSTDTLQHDAVESATFAVGLRLDHTPFPTLPAGALLLFEVDHATGHVHDVLALKNQNSVVADIDMDLVLVVNDKNSNGGGELDLTVSRLQPLAGSLAQKLGKAMGDASGAVRVAGQGLIKQGRMLPDDAAALRSQAQGILATDCACDVSQYPEPLKNAYVALIDKEIVQIERQVEVQSITRQRDILVSQLKQDQDDVAANGAQARVLTLVPGWALANLDGNQLRVSVRNLLELVNDDLYPAAELRYPATLAKIRSDGHLLGELQQLTAIDWQTPTDIVAVSTAAVKAVTDIGAYFNDSAGASDPSASVTLPLAFANPAFALPAKPAWIEADSARASGLWDIVNASTAGTPSIASIEVKPEDLYRVGSGLSCGDTAPVLQGMALYAAVADDSTAKTFNGEGKWLPLNIDPDQSYPTSSGVLPFRFDDSGNTSKWLSDKKLNVYTGLSVNAASTFASFFRPGPNGVATTAAGLSPFGHFGLDVSLLKQLFGATVAQTVRELVVVLQMETKANGRVTGVQSCQ